MQNTKQHLIDAFKAFALVFSSSSLPYILSAARLHIAFTFCLYSFPHLSQPPYHYVQGRFGVVLLPVRFRVNFSLFPFMKFTLPLFRHEGNVLSGGHLDFYFLDDVENEPAGVYPYATPNFSSWPTFPLIRVFRPSNDDKVNYEIPLAQPLGIQNANLNSRLQE